MLGFALSENVVYFRTVTEAVHNRKDEGTSRFRLAGGVVKTSVVDTRHGVNFLVTDGKNTVAVHHDGDTPALFKPGAPVVVEGHWASKSSQRAVLVRSHPDPARRRLHPAEGEHRQGPEFVTAELVRMAA